MTLDKRSLLEFLEEVDRASQEAMTLVAVGGTALTLMDVKRSTRDVDFTGPGPAIAALRGIVRGLKPGFKVDAWPDGQVFLVTLPSDYLERARPARRFRRIELRHLHPVDLVVTKVARFDERDQEDVEAAVRRFSIEPRAVAARAARISYAGNGEVFQANLDVLLRKMRTWRSAR